MYEILTGRLPFNGDYEQAVLYSILNEEPEPINGLRTDIPNELERIVSKALKKNREARYQRINDMLTDMKLQSEKPEAGKEGVLLIKKREKPLIVGLFFLVALVVVSGILYWWQGKSI